ncbi:MAG: Na+/H+ antiporter [Candidatus Acidiferrales bacterium]
MNAAGIRSAETVVLLLLFFVVILAVLAKRFKTPYPIVLVIGGLLISFIPGIPRVTLHPSIIFLGVLPPLLFSSAFVTSWRDFRYGLVSIIFLAFGLVGFTVWGVAATTRWFLPGFNWETGLILGAVVATTDSIAATSIAKRLRLPRKLVDVLEGESLVNDATGLLALQIAVGLVVTGRAPSLARDVATMLYLVFGSILLGLGVAWCMHWIETRIEDAAVEITVSLMAPYFSYLIAESLHASGVLATVVCGLYLGHKSSLYFSTAARLTSDAVWSTLTFVLNGLVFILIGLQLPVILSQFHGMGMSHLLFYGALVSIIVILLRMIWVFPGAFFSNWMRRRVLGQPEPFPDRRAVFVLGWAGMRGVVALAAAISLPKFLGDGEPFPERAMIIFLTFCVIFVTLVLQGLTLPPLIRRLGISTPEGVNPEEQFARQAVADAALAYLEHAKEGDKPEFARVYDLLVRAERHRLNVLTGKIAENTGYSEEDYQRFREIAGQLRALQRATLLHLRNENQINDNLMRKLEREVDIMETRPMGL